MICRCHDNPDSEPDFLSLSCHFHRFFLGTTPAPVRSLHVVSGATRPQIKSKWTKIGAKWSWNLICKPFVISTNSGWKTSGPMNCAWFGILQQAMVICLCVLGLAWGTEGTSQDLEAMKLKPMWLAIFSRWLPDWGLLLTLGFSLFADVKPIEACQSAGPRATVWWTYFCRGHARLLGWAEESGFRCCDEQNRTFFLLKYLWTKCFIDGIVRGWHFLLGRTASAPASSEPSVTLKNLSGNTALFSAFWSEESIEEDICFLNHSNLINFINLHDLRFTSSGFGPWTRLGAKVLIDRGTTQAFSGRCWTCCRGTSVQDNSWRTFLLHTNSYWLYII